jgi:hypothetical protein
VRSGSLFVCLVEMQEFCVRTADLTFGAVSCHPSLRFKLQGGLHRFLAPPGLRCDLMFDAVLRDEVVYAPKRVLFDDPVACAVGEGDAGQILIRGWTKPAPYCVAEVDAAWSRGIVYVPAARAGADRPIYPLDKIDVVITVNRLALAGDLLVHGAGILDGRRAYLFVGPSGAGKSTISGLWACLEDATVLGEDHTLVVQRQGRFWVFGGPWHSDPGRCAPLGAPLSAVFVLSHGPKTRATPCGRLEGVTSLLTNCFLPVYRRAAMAAVLDNMGRLCQEVPVFRLEFRPDRSAVEVVRSL